MLDAELGGLSAEAAIYRFLLWNEGEFELEFREVKREDKLGVSTQGLLMEGMRRLDEWSRLQEQLPSLQTGVRGQPRRAVAAACRRFPTRSTKCCACSTAGARWRQVLDESRGDDLATLNAINKLYFEGFLMVRETPAPEDENTDDVLIGAIQEPEVDPDAEALLPAAELEAPLTVTQVSAASNSDTPSEDVRALQPEALRAAAVASASSAGQAVVQEVQAGTAEVAGVPLAAVKLKRVPATQLAARSSPLLPRRLPDRPLRSRPRCPQRKTSKPVRDPHEPLPLRRPGRSGAKTWQTERNGLRYETFHLSGLARLSQAPRPPPERSPTTSSPCRVRARRPRLRRRRRGSSVASRSAMPSARIRRGRSKTRRRLRLWGVHESLEDDASEDVAEEQSVSRASARPGFASAGATRSLRRPTRPATRAQARATNRACLRSSVVPCSIGGFVVYTKV